MLRAHPHWAQAHEAVRKDAAFEESIVYWIRCQSPILQWAVTEWEVSITPTEGAMEQTATERMELQMLFDMVRKIDIARLVRRHWESGRNDVSGVP